MKTRVEEAREIHDAAVVELREAKAALQLAQERVWKAEGETARTGVNITWAYQEDAARAARNAAMVAPSLVIV